MRSLAPAACSGYMGHICVTYGSYMCHLRIRIYEVTFTYIRTYIDIAVHELQVMDEVQP